MPAAQAGKAAKVTLVVDDVPVVQVLQTLAEQERQNLVVSPDVSGTLSLHLTDVPWKQALQTVVNSAGLVLRQEGEYSPCSFTGLAERTQCAAGCRAVKASG